MNTLKAPQTHTEIDFLEHPTLEQASIRDTILKLGYDYFVFKSKVKKALLILKRRIIR